MSQGYASQSGGSTATNILVAATPDNYTPAAANVESHLAAVDTALAVPASPGNYSPTGTTVSGHLAGIDTKLGTVAGLAAADEYNAAEAVNAGDLRVLQALTASNRNAATLAGTATLSSDPAQALGRYEQDFDPDGVDRYVDAHAAGSGILRVHLIRNTGGVGEKLLIRDGSTVLGTCYPGEFGLLVDFAGDGTWAWVGGGEVRQVIVRFDPKAVCDGAIDRVPVMRVDESLPNGIYLTGWSLTFLQNPGTEIDLDLKRADDLIGVASAAVMDVLDTTAGASAETTASNINSGAVVDTGQDIYLEFGTAYTDAGESCLFTLRYLKR